MLLESADDIEKEPLLELNKEVDISRFEKALDLDNFNGQSAQDVSDIEAMIIELENDVVVY